MAICSKCQIRGERPCNFSERTREYFDAIMPALKFVAYRCGYALAVHGSLKTDIDLLAVPWRESAISAKSLAEHIKLSVEQIIGTARTRECDGNPTAKPCGRLAWSFYLQPEGVDGPYIDLSVMSKDAHPRDIFVADNLIGEVEEPIETAKPKGSIHWK